MGIDILAPTLIKYVKWKLSVTQLQPSAQSATLKLLLLRFNLMILSFSKMSSLREHLSGLKNFACYAE